MGDAMIALEKTARAFVASVRDALPDHCINISRSVNTAGRSVYVYISGPRCHALKVRISDHPIGMRRARSGDCALYLPAGAKPAAWAVWLSEVVKYASAAREHAS